MRERETQQQGCGGLERVYHECRRRRVTIEMVQSEQKGCSENEKEQKGGKGDA